MIDKYEMMIKNDFIGFMNEREVNKDTTDYLNIKNELDNYQTTTENTKDFFNKDDIDYLLSFQYEYGKKRGIEAQLVAPLIIALSYYLLFEQMHISNLQIADVDLLNSRIKNPRASSNIFVKQWIPLNDTVIELLRRYLDYRSQFSLLKDNDKLIVLNGQKLDNRSINEVLNIFNDTKGNTNRLSTRVNLQKIIRTRILFDLEETNGHSLIDFFLLIGLKKNTQLKTAIEEYLMRTITKI